MSTSNYRISELAIKDMNEIWLYTFHKWSQEQADRYYNLIMDEITFISSNYTLGKSISGIRKNYRFTKVKSDLIFYRMNEDEVVEIVRVLHKRMEVKKHLK